VTLDRGPDEVRDALKGVAGVADLSHLGDEGIRRRYALTSDDPAAVAPGVARAVAERGWALYGLETERRDLEALFGAVSGTAAAGEAAHV
jgi:ABC-2 type transport system ATP-binding protein